MYTVKDVAKMTNMTEDTVRQWIRNKMLKAEASESVKLGYSISETDIIYFLIDQIEMLSDRQLICSYESEVDWINGMIKRLEQHKRELNKIIKDLRSS